MAAMKTNMLVSFWHVTMYLRSYKYLFKLRNVPLQVRSLSTSSAASQMVKPPVQVFGLEGRYASALYSAASKNKTLDAVEKELVQFQKSVKADPKLKEFLINPTLKRNLKVDALKHLGTKVSQLLLL